MLPGQEYNRSAVNKGFESKKNVYCMSEISMTHDLTFYDSWSIKEIEKRLEKLADVALEIWKKIQIL